MSVRFQPHDSALPFCAYKKATESRLYVWFILENLFFTFTCALHCKKHNYMLERQHKTFALVSNGAWQAWKGHLKHLTPVTQSIGNAASGS